MQLKVYIDLLLLFNFLIDALLLLSVACLLKRKVSFYRVVFASFLGSFSIFFLFLPLSNLLLLFLKVLVSILLILITFSYRNFSYFWKNISYFYFTSIVLGGVIYLWNVSFPTTFFSSSYALNFFLLLFLAPIAIAYYVRKMRGMQENYLFYQEVQFSHHQQTIRGIGYLDSGNCLTYKRRPVVLATHQESFLLDDYFLLPYQTASGMGMLKCIFLREMWVQKKKWQNIYLGVMEEEIALDGVDFLLHHSMIGGFYD